MGGDVEGDAFLHDESILGRSPSVGKGKSRTAPLAKSLLSVEEAALLLGVDRATCYRAIRSEKFPLPFVRLGGRIRIPRRAVERLMDGVVHAQDANSVQLAAAFDRCPACGTPSPALLSPPSSRRPTCSAARRSSAATTSV
jgi:excisionase family DNA binding protein